MGYPTRTAAIVALRAQGLSREIIAERIGIAVGTVAALESSFRRTGAGIEYCRPIILSNEQVAIVHPYANARGTTVEALMKQVVRTIISERLIDAVLDDGVTS